MIEFDHVSISYASSGNASAPRPVLRRVDLRIDEGELCLVVGPTGAGKSTLLGAINGHVPHFTGGTLEGTVRVGGLDTRTNPPRHMAEHVGVVVQDPIRGFVTDTVEAELAYGMEQLGVAPAVMRTRVEETLDLLGIADLRHRPLRTLSGGQQQRVAIGAVLTARPRVVVLDEPTSALDPTAAEDVLATLTRLVHDLGITVVMAEHRLERVVEYADRVVLLTGDGTVRHGDPATMMQRSPVAPPVVRLGQLAGWNPLPLSVRDARRLADPLRRRIAGRVPARPQPAGSVEALSARGVTVRYGEVVAVRDVDLTVHQGEVVALMGRNGSGKTSLLWAAQGGISPSRGTVTAAGAIGLVPQSPGDVLYLPSVAEECAASDRGRGMPAGTCRRVLDRIVPGLADDTHPRDLSEGQRLALALAVQLTPDPPVLLLDEPTRGLDELAKERLAVTLDELAATGRAIVVATHDVEFVARVAARVILMAEGEIVADGATADIAIASPTLAPQVAKVLHPEPWLTVGQLVASGVFDDAEPVRG